MPAAISWCRDEHDPDFDEVGTGLRIRSCSNVQSTWLGIEDDIMFIERVPTLRMLGRDALRILAIGAESRYVHKGEVLFTAGETADCGFVIQEGSFRLEDEIEAGRRDSSSVRARCSARWR